MDLRSLTTFGLNAKPETSNPIGYFGTGLKYAVAVLAREGIPVTFWIDDKKWTVEKVTSTFRNKEFTELFIQSWGVLGLKKVIKLPFTTLLGKNWELWQAFRELESNTRDEKGETYVVGEWYDSIIERNHTLIQVDSEAFVQEYFDRDKTFLKDGLTQREGDDQIQVFDAPSRSIYYRGIRIYDLPEKERSLLTYNILAPIELTEDRTAKSPYDIQWKIQNYIAEKAPQEFISKAVTAPEGTLERKLYYDYAIPSPTFIETASKHTSNLTYYAKQTYEKHRPREKEPIKLGSWIERLLYYLKDDDWDAVLPIVKENKDALINILVPLKPLPMGLELAVAMLSPLMPGDSRAVPDEFVALTALLSGDNSPEVTEVIETKLREYKKDDKIINEHALGTGKPDLSQHPAAKETSDDDIPF